MAYTVALVSGKNDLVQNQVYAMPGLAKWVTADSVLAVATTVGGAFVNVAATTTGGALIGGGTFVKSAAASNVAVLSNQ